MFPLLFLAAAAPPPPPPRTPLAEGAVLSSAAQWDAVAASPRLVMQRGGFGKATGVTLAVRDEYAYVLTALHAIPETTAEREVQFFTRDSYPEPARRVMAVEVAARWPDPDLALLKVKVGPDPVPTLPLAGAGQRPRDFPFDSLSVGCSEGNPPTCRVETVVAKRYARRPGGKLAFFWELDVAPVPGRSGGPLLDGQGRVIGVCAAAKESRGYYTHLDEILAGLKREGYGWLWQTAK